MSNFCISDQNVKPKTRTGLKSLHNLHIYSVLTAKVILSSIIISVSLWLFARMPEPEIHVRRFTVDALHPATQGRNLLNYDFTVHNPDLYKSIRYDVLVLYIAIIGEDNTGYATTINFDPDSKGIQQGPGERTILPNHSLNYADLGWNSTFLMTLKLDDKIPISLVFVMEVKFFAFNKVIGTRQTTRLAEIYFDDNGNAFIDRRAGLKLTA